MHSPLAEVYTHIKDRTEQTPKVMPLSLNTMLHTSIYYTLHEN